MNYNSYTSIDKGEELGEAMDELLYLSKGITKALDEDKKKVNELKEEYSVGSALLSGAQDALLRLKNSRVGKNKLTVLLIVMIVIFVLWLL